MAEGAKEEKKTDSAEADSSGGDGGKKKKRRAPGLNKGDPVDLQFLVKFWMLCWGIPKLRPKMVKINAKAQGVLASATAGWVYIILVVKPKFATNTVGALLELADDPIVSAFLPIRGLLNMIVSFPVIQGLLRAFRDAAVPLLEKAGKIAGAVQKGKDIKEKRGKSKEEKEKKKEEAKASDEPKQGLGERFKSNVSEKYDKAKEGIKNAPANIKKAAQDKVQGVKDSITNPIEDIKGRAGVARDMRNYYKDNQDKIKEAKDQKQEANKEDKASRKGWDIGAQETAGDKRKDAEGKLDDVYQGGADKARESADKNMTNRDKDNIKKDEAYKDENQIGKEWGESGDIPHEFQSDEYADKNNDKKSGSGGDSEEGDQEHSEDEEESEEEDNDNDDGDQEYDDDDDEDDE